MLQGGFGQPEIAGAPQPQCADRLGMGSFDARSLGIPLAKFRGVLLAPCLLQGFKLGLMMHRKGSGCIGRACTQGAARTGATVMQPKTHGEPRMTVLIGALSPFHTSRSLEDR